MAGQARTHRGGSLNTRYPGHIVEMDTFSSYGWAELYTDKSVIGACDFLAHIQGNRSDIPIHAVLTDNEACERLNRTILEEFHQLAFRSKIYSSVEELNQDLQGFLAFYNTRRTHQGKRVLRDADTRDSVRFPLALSWFSPHLSLHPLGYGLLLISATISLSLTII